MDDGTPLRELNLTADCGESCWGESSPPSTKIMFGQLTVILVGAGSPISII